jgi:hypothetical protein
MSPTPDNGGRVTTREFYVALLDQNKQRADMETRLIEKITEERIAAATDRTAVKSLLRRDTIGYVWDSFNTIIATIVIALYWGRS